MRGKPSCLAASETNCPTVIEFKCKSLNIRLSSRTAAAGNSARSATRRRINSMGAPGAALGRRLSDNFSFEPDRCPALRRFGNRRKLARVREKFWLPIQRERTGEAVGEERRGVHRRAQRKGRAEGLQQSAEGISAGIQRDDRNVRRLAHQVAQHRARPDFDQ